MKPGVSIRTKILRKDNARIAREHSEMIKTDIEHDARMLLVEGFTRNTRRVVEQIGLKARRRRKLPCTWACTDSTKRGRYAAYRNWTSNIPWREAHSMIAHGAVVIRLKLDVMVVAFVFFDNERSTSILWITFSIANIKHLAQLNRWLIRGLELLNLLKQTTCLMETGSKFRGAHGIETLDRLNH